MAPIRKGDGTPLEIPGVSEVRSGDGRVFFEGDAIPDSDVYLHDDWGDNKLQDREDSGTTTHNGVEGVYRPEWDQVNSDDLPSASNEELVVERDEYMITDVNINLNEAVTWEFNNVDVSNVDGRTFVITLFAEDDTVITGDTFDAGAAHEGYAILFRPEFETQRLREVDENGNTTDLITWDIDTETFNATVTRTSSGEFEVIIDGDSQGTETDTTHETANYVSAGVRDADDPMVTLNELKIS